VAVCRYCGEQFEEEQAIFCPFCSKKNPIRGGHNSISGFLVATFFFVIFSSILFYIFIGPYVYNSGIFGNFETFVDTNNKVTINYPVNWESREDFDNNTVVAFRPPSSDSNSHDIGFSVSVDKLLFYIPLNMFEIKKSYDQQGCRTTTFEKICTNVHYGMDDASCPQSSSDYNSVIVNSSDYNSLRESCPDYDIQRLILKVPWNLSLEEYTKYRIDALKIRYPDINYSSISLDGKNAINATYTFSTNTKGKEFRVTQIWTIDKDEVYILTDIANKSQYSSYVSIIKKMINSFRFGDHCCEKF
jgi:hypothetical protein